MIHKIIVYFVIAFLVSGLTSGQSYPDKYFINQNFKSFKDQKKYNNITPEVVKNLNNDEFKLDSLLAFDEFGNKKSIYTFTYDSLGHIKKRLQKKWINNSLLIKKNSYSYDLNSNLIQVLEENWENETNLEPIRLTFKYDTFGHKTEYLMEIFLDAGWQYYEKKVYNYNSDDLLSSFSLWEYDHNMDSWRENFCETYSYENGKLIQILLEEKIGENRKYSKKYTYDNNGNVLTILSESFVNDIWIPVNMFCYSYDTSNNLINILIKYNSVDTLQNYSLTTFYFSNENNLLSKILQIWEDNKWEDFSKTDFMYDNENILSKIEIDNIMYNYDERYLFNSDGYGNIVSGKYERFIENQWIAHNYGTFDDFLEVLKENDVILYNHSFVAQWIQFGQVKTKNCISDKEPIKIYPNIAFNQITIETDAVNNSSILIFDSNGAAILNKKVADSKTNINISHLKPGIYFVRIKDNNKYGFGRFIKL